MFIQFFRPLHRLFIFGPQHKRMRCDLHVHSIGSGMCDTPGLSHVCRESYNQPATVYDHLKRRRMSIVTLTDHDSIDAAEALRHKPDFFLSEEVTVRMPSGTQMHLGVYGLTERDHTEIQRRRNDFMALLMYLTERELFFSVNHVFSGLNGRRHEDDFNRLASHVPAFETRNGQMWTVANLSAEHFAKRLSKIGIAGSDSHTLAGLGLTYTEVPRAHSVPEFLAGLRAGCATTHGVHGSYAKLTADVYRLVKALFQEKPWMLAFWPLALLVPAFTASHWVNEMRFCRKWSSALSSEPQRPRMLWNFQSRWEAKTTS